jgi:ABC-type maltose transport system permease subunit
MTEQCNDVSPCRSLGTGSDYKTRRAGPVPWNATALVYALPSIAIYHALRRYMVAGLAPGGLKG